MMNLGGAFLNKNQVSSLEHKEKYLFSVVFLLKLTIAGNIVFHFINLQVEF